MLKNCRSKSGVQGELTSISDRLHPIMMKIMNAQVTVVKDDYDPNHEFLWRIKCDLRYGFIYIDNYFPYFICALFNGL